MGKLICIKGFFFAQSQHGEPSFQPNTHTVDLLPFFDRSAILSLQVNIESIDWGLEIFHVSAWYMRTPFEHAPFTNLLSVTHLVHDSGIIMTGRLGRRPLGMNKSDEIWCVFVADTASYSRLYF